MLGNRVASGCWAQSSDSAGTVAPGYTAWCSRPQARLTEPWRVPSAPRTRCIGDQALPDISPDFPLLLASYHLPLQRRKRDTRPRDPGPGPGGVETTATRMQRRAAGPVRNEGNRARERRPGRPRLRARAPGGTPVCRSPTPSLPPNQRPLPASLPANPHTPRRIALGGVWESAESDGLINQPNPGACAGGRDLALAAATQERGADAGPGFVQWGSLARRSRQSRPLGFAARDGCAASAAVFTAARGQVCGREEARVPPAVPLRLEVRREAWSCSRACEDPWGPGYAAPRPRARGAGRGRGRGVRLGFESSGPGGRSGREGRAPNLGRLSWGARPKPRRRGREAWQVP